MAYTKDELEKTITQALADADQGAAMERVTSTVGQLGPLALVAGSVAIAPLAGSVAIVGGAVGLGTYGMLQLVQSRRLGHFLPIPGVPMSLDNLTHGVTKTLGNILNQPVPEKSEPIRINNSDWLSDRDRRQHYLLMYADDIIIEQTLKAKDGTSFQTVVDMAVRASELVISDEEIRQPLLAHKAINEVRMALKGDTTGIELKEAKQAAKVLAEAKRETAAGRMDEKEYEALAEQVKLSYPKIEEVSTAVSVPVVTSEPVSGTPTVTPESVGNQTQLGAIDVPAIPVNTPAVEIDFTPVEETTAQPETDPMEILFDGGTLSAKFLNKPMAERAQIMLQLLKEAGCDIEQFVGDQLLGSTGTQRAGKTTLLLCLSILEMAMGKQCHYITVDDDLYPVAFTSATAGLTTGKAAYQKFFTDLQGLKKGQHKDIIYFLDEATKATNQLGESSRDSLWSGLLTGFIKTGASARIVVHGITSSAMGIPNGFAAQAKDEATFFKALRARDVHTDRSKYEGSGKYPSGQYRGLTAVGHNYEANSNTFALPDWLKFDTTQGHPCYVRSLLRFFPELDTRAEGAIPKPYGEKQKAAIKLPTQFSAPVVEDDTHTADVEEVTLSSNIGVNLKPNIDREELGDSGLTVDEACNTIAKYLHKNYGKTRGLSSILSQAFSTKKQEALKPFSKALIRKVAKDNPENFQLAEEDGDLKLTCVECRLSEKAYYPL